MRIGGWSMVWAALALGACSSEPAEAPRQEPRAEASAEPAAIAGAERRILAFGDSLFAGYGLGEGEGYPDKLEAALRAKGINARVADAGVSGDTTAAGLQRLAFVLDSQPQPPELAIIELGGNDLLRGISPAETRENLAAILAELRKRKIPVLLMGMRAPPNLGKQFVDEFDGIYPDLARSYSVKLVPFFLEPVFDKPQLIQADRIHPTAAGIDAMVAATVDDVAGALPPTS